MEKEVFEHRDNRCFLLLLFFLPAFCFLPAVSNSQISFERTYGGLLNDQGYSVQQTSDGGYVITGCFGRVPYDYDADVYEIKTDSLGDTLWTRIYGDSVTSDSTSFTGYSIQETSDGGYFIAGATKDDAGRGTEIKLIKTNPQGDTLWTRFYDSLGIDGTDDRVYSAMQTSDGGYILAGGTDCGAVGRGEVLLIKTDSLGDTLWIKTFGDTISWDEGHSVQQTQDGGYIIAGLKDTRNGPWDVYLIKTDSMGETLWTKTYGGGEIDYAWSVDRTSDGGYIIAGITHSYGAGADDVYLIKTNSWGFPLWQRTFGGPALDHGYSVQQTSDGGYVIVGCKDCWETTSQAYLIKTDSVGYPLCERTFGSPQSAEARSVQETSDGGFIITGWKGTWPFREVYLIKTDTDCQVGNEEERQDAGLRNSQFLLTQNHPNPFNQFSVIRYQIPYMNLALNQVQGRITSHVLLSIYDITGRLVETLVDEPQTPGVYQIQWTPDSKTPGLIHSRTPSGIYFYRLQSGEFTSTKKMTLLR